MTFDAVYRCAVAMLGGAVLHACNITAGNGSVIDWNGVKSGETLESGMCAAGAAQLFVALVGPEAAIASLRENNDAPAEFVAPPPAISTFMRRENGERMRSFRVGPFAVTTIRDDREGDDGAEAFTVALAAAAVSIAREVSS